MPHTMSRAETVLRAIAPDDLAPADHVLAGVLRRPRRARRRWALVGGATLVGVGLAGGAVAGGLVPTSVVDRLTSGDQDDPFFQVHDIRRVFALETADGTTVAMFIGPNEVGGYCSTVTHGLDADTEPEDLAYTCVSGDVLPRVTPDGVGLIPTDSEHPGPPILFGSARGGFELPTGTTDVHVSGPTIDATLPVESAEGWAIEVPFPDTTAIYVVEFVADDGTVLDRTRLQVEALTAAELTPHERAVDAHASSITRERRRRCVELHVLRGR